MLIKDGLYEGYKTNYKELNISNYYNREFKLIITHYNEWELVSFAQMLIKDIKKEEKSEHLTEDMLNKKIELLKK